MGIANVNEMIEIVTAIDWNVLYTKHTQHTHTHPYQLKCYLGKDLTHSSVGGSLKHVFTFGNKSSSQFEKPPKFVFSWMSVRDSCCDYGNSKYLFEAEMSMLVDPNQVIWQIYKCVMWFGRQVSVICWVDSVGNQKAAKRRKSNRHRWLAKHSPQTVYLYYSLIPLSDVGEIQKIFQPVE